MWKNKLMIRDKDNDRNSTSVLFETPLEAEYYIRKFGVKSFGSDRPCDFILVPVLVYE